MAGSMGSVVGERLTSLAEFALEKNIRVIQPTSLRLNGKHPEDASVALNELSACDFDVMVVAAYGLILPKEVFEIAEQKGIEVTLEARSEGFPLQVKIEAEG